MVGGTEVRREGIDDFFLLCTIKGISLERGLKGTSTLARERNYS